MVPAPPPGLPMVVTAVVTALGLESNCYMGARLPESKEDGAKRNVCAWVLLLEIGHEELCPCPRSAWAQNIDIHQTIHAVSGDEPGLPHRRFAAFSLRHVRQCATRACTSSTQRSEAGKHCTACECTVCRPRCMRPWWRLSPLYAIPCGGRHRAVGSVPNSEKPTPTHT